MHASDPSSSYRGDRLSPVTRFDEVETTVSHLFRRPHPALAGRSYGGALYAALAKRGLISTPHIWELGAGAGFVAAAMVAAAPEPLGYTFLELSLPLLQLQRRQVAAAGAVRAHAERLPFRRGSLRGLLLANEVIADLRVAPAGSEEAVALAERLGLEPPRGLVNVGAWRFLDELARVLTPGSSACLTEFGGEMAPSAVPLEGPLGVGHHVEHSIHFGQLERGARTLGFEVERVLLADLLEIDRTMRVASYPDLRRLRRLAPRTPIIAAPKTDLVRAHPLLTRLFRFDFPRIGDPTFPEPQARGGFCQLFHALLLRRL